MNEAESQSGKAPPVTGPDRVLAVVPAFNEEEALGDCVRELLSVCPQVDVLIVNDGSTDATAKVAGQLAQESGRVQWTSLPFNCGIGATVQTGLMFALANQYSFAVQYDGDGQHDPKYIIPMVEEAREKGLDLCVGSRFIDVHSDSFRSTRLRRIGIIFFARLIGALASVKVTDPTSGFRVYRRKAIELFAEHYPEDYPEPEALFRCARNGLKVGEYPVQMRERQGGRSSIRYMRTAYYMVKVTLAILVDRIRSKEKVTEHDS